MRASSWVVMCGVWAAVGCGGAATKAPDAQDGAESIANGGDAGPAATGSAEPRDARDGGEDGVSAACQRKPAVEPNPGPRNDQVDLLFVVDNSFSMQEEQANLAAQLPKLVSILSTGRLEDANGKVVRQFPQVKSLHLGVTSSDMGVNGLPADVASQLNCPALGNDGLLLNTQSPDLPGCAERTFASSYLDFTAGRDDATELGRDFACITSLGTAGCGIEQQLEAMWKALAPSTDSSFSQATRGHGDAENAGFLRENSVIAVIHVSDEEDCSIPDSSRALFDPGSERDTLNVRCLRNPVQLHPAGRYINGLKSLRPSNPEQVIFAAIVGIPPAAEAQLKGGQQDFDGILAREDMQYRELPDDPAIADPILPQPACETANGKAYAPRRFVEVAKGFGKNGLVRSICQEDFSGALGGIIDKIAVQLEADDGKCQGDAECPEGWLCDMSDADTSGLCLNPACTPRIE